MRPRDAVRGAGEIATWEYQCRGLVFVDDKTKTKIDHMANFGFVISVSFGAIGTSAKMNAYSIMAGVARIHHIGARPPAQSEHDLPTCSKSIRSVAG